LENEACKFFSAIILLSFTLEKQTLMKIILVGPYPEDTSCIKGGTESSVFGLAHCLANQHEVVVLDYPRVNGQDAKESEQDLQVYRYRTNGKHYEDAVSRMADICLFIEHYQPNVVHIHGTHRFCFSLYQWCKKQEINTMLTVHGLAAVEKRNALKAHISLKAIYQYVRQSYYERRLLCSADKCIVDTGYVREAIEQYGLRKVPDMYVIPQGINSRYFDIEPSEERLKRKIILSVGTMSARKGRMQLLQAFDIVCRSVPDAELAIAGVNKDKGTYQKMLAYIAASPNKDRIRLYPDVPQEQLSHHASSRDYLVDRTSLQAVGSSM
jgi:glycosyltransferase involved in cell wall biosynthesis